MAIDDGVAVHFLNDQVHRVVASRQGATAYRVQAANATVHEAPMPVEYLPPQR
jgi:peptidase E